MIAIALSIVVSGLIVAAGAAICVRIYASGYGGDIVEFVVISVLTIVIAALTFPLTIHVAGRFTGGLMPDYASGHRTGYITKLSLKGMFWQTNESQIQVGVGEMASLQEPFKVSIADPAILAQANELCGTDTRVKVHYTQWLVQPLWRGRSGYEVTKLEVIADEP